MKKLVSMLLVLAMLVTVFAGLAITASAADAALTVYTQAGADGEKTLAKSYTAEELKKLAETKADGYGYQYFKKGEQDVVVTEYVTLDTLLTDADVTFADGDSLAFVCDDGPYTKFNPTYKDITEGKYYFKDGKAEEVPAALALVWGAGAAADGTVADIAKTAKDTGSLRFVCGTTEADFTAEKAAGKRLPSGVVELIVVIAILGILAGIAVPAYSGYIKKANEAGIPVVMFNVQDELADGKVDCYVTYDQREGGAKVADYMAEVVNGAETNVAIIEGLPSEHTTARMGGFSDRVAEKYPNIHVVASQSGDWEREKGMNAAANMMQSVDIDAFFGLCDEMSLGAVQAVKQANGKQLVFSFDGNPNAAEAVKSGDLMCTLSIGGLKTGEECVNMIDKILKGETVDKFFTIETEVITKDNVDAYLATFE